MSLTRRQFVNAAAVWGALWLSGCARGRGRAAPRLVVYRDPACGCCEAWAKQATDAGFDVTLLDKPEMAAIKQRLGVPADLTSCHTAVSGSFVFEGHVPFAAIQRILDEEPVGVTGLAVAGMPRGAPGMEMPDGSHDRFQVMAFGPTRRFSYD